ncbi:MAG: hypothetical protein JW807_01820 [Spirochaetes bacterium]|nr:hypothetical protein [Spirochaetota bacterium]
MSRNSLRRLWNKLTAPRAGYPDEARREHMTKVISLIMGITAFPFGIIFFIGWLLKFLPLDSFIFTIVITLIMISGWQLSYRGFWRLAGYFPPVITFLAAVYGSYIGGPGAPAMLLYALSIMLASMLQGQRAQWITLILSVAAYAGIGTAHIQGLISPLRTYQTAFLNRLVIITAIYAALTLLLWFLTNQYRNTLAHSLSTARQLQEIAAELKESNLNLETEIAEKIRAENLIIASLREKEVLLKEVHHRVKNNFQIIISLLNLQANKINNNDITRHFSDSMSRIRAMALVHERLYQSEDISEIDFASYINTISQEIYLTSSSAAVRPKLLIDTEEIHLNLDQAIPYGLILNELLTNALKYAFPEAGNDHEIAISLHSDAREGIILGVCDNGIGIPADINVEHSPTLGLQLVILLVKQIHGTYELKRDCGTAWYITLPTKETSS